MNENSIVELSAESCSNVMLQTFPSVDIPCEVYQAPGLGWTAFFSGLFSLTLVLTPGKGDARPGLGILAATSAHTHKIETQA